MFRKKVLRSERQGVLHIESVGRLSRGQILMAYNELNPKKAERNKKKIRNEGELITQNLQTVGCYDLDNLFRL